MDTLQQTLSATARKRASDAVWAAADAAHFVLNEFRERVANNTLETSVGEKPFYSFNTNTLCAPEAATYRVADWVRNESFVCAVIRDSTGMGVRCVGGVVYLDADQMNNCTVSNCTVCTCAGSMCTSVLGSPCAIELNGDFVVHANISTSLEDLLPALVSCATPLAAQPTAQTAQPTAAPPSSPVSEPSCRPDNVKLADDLDAVFFSSNANANASANANANASASAR